MKIIRTNYFRRFHGKRNSISKSSHSFTWILTILEQMLIFEAENNKNTLKLSFSGIGSMNNKNLMVESSLEHIPKLKYLKSEAEMLIFHSFYKQNVISSPNISIFHRF